MPHEDSVPGSPADWLRYASSDLALSRAALPADILLETLCFHTQQAAEKALKAVLIAKGIVPPRTHNIRTLLDLLPPDVVQPPKLQATASLTVYSVMSRYPTAFEPIGKEEQREAIELAEAVVS